MSAISSVGKQALNTVSSTSTQATPPAAKPAETKAPAASAAPQDEFIPATTKAAPVALSVPETVTSRTTEAKSAFGLPNWVTDNPIVNGAKDLYNSAKAWAANASEALDVKGSINKLGAGDKYTIGLKASAGLSNVTTESKYKAEVEAVPVTDASGKPVLDGNGQPKLKYTMSVDGDIAAGLFGSAKGADGKALVGTGGKVEMSFDTAEEAARAVELSLRAPTSGYSNPTPGRNDDTKLNAEEMKFLQSHVSAVEVRGTTAAELTAKMGLVGPLSETSGMGIGTEQALRVEFNPPAVVLKEQGQVSAQISAGAGVQGTPGNSASVSGAGVNGKLTVATESRYTLPAGTNVNSLKTDPIGTLKSLGGAALTPVSEKLTLTQEMEAAGLGNGGGIKNQLVITEGADAALKAGVVTLAQTGNWSAALQAGGDRVAGEYTSTGYTQSGVSIAPGFEIKGTGIGMEIAASRQDFVSPPFQSSSFTGQQTKKAQQQKANGQP